MQFVQSFILVLGKMAIERDYRRAIWVVLAYVLAMVAVYWFWWKDTADLSQAGDLSLFILIAIAVAIPVFLIGMMVTYAGEGSKLYGLKPVSDKWPAIKKPEGHVRFRTKMLVSGSSSTSGCSAQMRVSTSRAFFRSSS